MKDLVTCFLLLALSTSCFTRDIFEDNDDSDYYTGAVVEYAAMDSDGLATAAEVMMYNLDQYNTIMGQANGSDIIVFPEYGITGTSVSGYTREKAMDYMVGAEMAVNYCELDNSPQVMNELSCMAARHNMYLVVNLGEVTACNATDCSDSENGLDWYNTNLAFDRKGNLVAKYWKQNLFMEPIFQVPREPVFTKFDTDFGVTFGMFICFDALWRVPAVELVDRYNLSHVVYSTAWQDELPFYQAVSTHSAWAVMKNVNFLGSGYHDPAMGKLGSGIYGPNGPIKYTFDQDSGTVLLMAKVPKVLDQLQSTESKPRVPESKPRVPDEKQMRLMDHMQTFEDLGNYSHIDLAPGHQHVEISHTDPKLGNTINCYVDYNLTTSSDGVSYRLLAFTGIRSLGWDNYHVGVEVCGVVQCHESFGTKFCGHYPVPSNSMQHCHLEGNFTTDMILPVVLTSSVQLPPAGGQFSTSKSPDEGVWFAEYSRMDVPDLYSMALYARK